MEDSGNSRFVLIHALRLHCWVHTKECRFFTLPDWFDSIFAVTGGTSSNTSSMTSVLRDIAFPKLFLVPSIFGKPDEKQSVNIDYMHYFLFLH